MRYPDDVLFCAKYLKDRGLLSKEILDSMNESLDGFTVTYELTKVDKGFLPELASKLRELWPPGEKDNKYSWRDSEKNIVKRLNFIWTERKLGDKYTLEDCLSVARRYLSQFEDNVKYMQLLKYFIFKQTSSIHSDGRIEYSYKSTFADMLENTLTVQDEPELTIFSEGTLI